MTDTKKAALANLIKENAAIESNLAIYASLKRIKRETV